MLPNRKAKYYWIDAGLLICGTVLLVFSKWIPGILLLMMALMGFLIRRKPYLHFSDRGVKIHMLWVKHHAWSDFNACMLKDGMLSLDFKNNRLFQEVISPNSQSGVNEADFNAFCIRKISEATDLTTQEEPPHQN